MDRQRIRKRSRSPDGSSDDGGSVTASLASSASSSDASDLFLTASDSGVAFEELHGEAQPTVWQDFLAHASDEVLSSLPIARAAPAGAASPALLAAKVRGNDSGLGAESVGSRDGSQAGSNNSWRDNRQASEGSSSRVSVSTGKRRAPESAGMNEVAAITLAVQANSLGRFDCPFPDCGKSFSYRANLRRHIMTHTGVRPFSCPLCDRSFVRSDDLAAHTKQHERALMPPSSIPVRPKRVRCGAPGCKASFTSLADLDAHTRMEHAAVGALTLMQSSEQQQEEEEVVSPVGRIARGMNHMNLASPLVDTDAGDAFAILPEPAPIVTLPAMPASFAPVTTLAASPLTLALDMDLSHAATTLAAAATRPAPQFSPITDPIMLPPFSGAAATAALPASAVSAPVPAPVARVAQLRAQYTSARNDLCTAAMGVLQLQQQVDTLLSLQAPMPSSAFSNVKGLAGNVMACVQSFVDTLGSCTAAPGMQQPVTLPIAHHTTTQGNGPPVSARDDGSLPSRHSWHTPPSPHGSTISAGFHAPSLASSAAVTFSPQLLPPHMRIAALPTWAAQYPHRDEPMVPADFLPGAHAAYMPHPAIATHFDEPMSAWAPFLL